MSTTTSELRFRREGGGRGRNGSSTTTKQYANGNADCSEAFWNEPVIDAGLTAPKMIRSGCPQHYGAVRKLHLPAFFCLLPLFLQRFIVRTRWLSCLGPTWRHRSLILVGSYLYKFRNLSSTSVSGAPLYLPHLQSVHLLNESHKRRHFDADADTALELLLQTEALIGNGASTNSNTISSCHTSSLSSSSAAAAAIMSTATVFVVVANGSQKRTYYAASNPSDAQVWIESLRQARQEAIVRSMGHIRDDSAAYPASWTAFDRLGNAEQKRRDRIRKRMQEMTTRELEWSAGSHFGDSGGPVHKAYYG